MAREIIRDESGEVIAAVCVNQPLSDEARAAFAELVRVARKKFAEDDPTGETAAKQAAAIKRIRERNARWAAPVASAEGGK